MADQDPREEQPSANSADTPVWSEARRAVEEGDTDGCSCHLNPPCTFCASMTEEEADVRWNDGMRGLRELWAEQDEPKES